MLPRNRGFLGPPMTSDDLLGITKYRKLNTGKLPVNSRTAKPRKNRKHRIANREQLCRDGGPRHPAPAHQPPAKGKSRNS